MLNKIKDLSGSVSVVFLPALQQNRSINEGARAVTIFCLACEAEARHMYCFFGVVVVVVVGGGVNFFAFRSFSRKL